MFIYLFISSSELSLVCSAEIVYSDPGDDVVLSCHLEPAISAVSMEIKWRNRADMTVIIRIDR